jgi:phage tail sheath protein FI
MKIVSTAILVLILLQGFTQQKLLLYTDSVPKTKALTKQQVHNNTTIEATITKELKILMNEYRNSANNASTWAVIKGKVSSLLLSYFNGGKLLGTKPSEAFFIRMDNTTMTPLQITANTKVLLVGIATKKPADFSIIRVQTESY